MENSDTAFFKCLNQKTLSTPPAIHADAKLIFSDIIKSKNAILSKLFHLKAKQRAVLNFNPFNEYRNLNKLKIKEKFLHLPATFLKLHAFKSFSYCQILIRPRGSHISHNLIYNKKEKLKITTISNDDFNSIFNIVKKSKNKFFNQSKSNYKLIENFGVFLAQDYSDINNNIILIISRNDFLLAQKEEAEAFAHAVNHFSMATITPVYAIYNKSKNSQLIKSFFSKYPLPLSIFSADQAFNFNNTGVLSHNVKINHHINSKVHFIVKKNKNSLISEIHHYQRISLLGELLNTLRHEINNPLFGIKLTAEILLDEEKDNPALPFIQDIHDATERCQNIISSFRDLYLSKNNSLEINLKNLIQTTIQLTKSETFSIKKIINIDPQCPKTLNINPTWPSQILFNLIINSAQAINESTLKIIDATIKINVTMENKIFILEVSDNGPGIKSAALDHVFDNFYTTKEKGTGLGLAICKNLASKLNAKLNFKNNSDGRGVTFKLKLPLNQADE